MRYSVFLFALGAFFTVVLTPLSMRTAAVLGAIDRPDGGRRRHESPTPRLGGLALYAASLLVSLLFLPKDPLYGAWLAGGGLLCALGVTDDLFSLSPSLKMVAQAAIATLPIMFGLSPHILTIGTPMLSLPHPLGNIFALLWVLLLTNAFNLIDGSDGLAVTLALCAALPLGIQTEEHGVLLLAGVALGFFPYNRRALTIHPSIPKRTRSFLGDTGSLFLGYSLALFSLHAGGGRFSLFTPLLFAIPLYDLVRVFFARILRRENPFHADRSHIHHRLADRGFRAGEILLVLGLYATLFSSLFLVFEAIFAHI